MKPIFKKFIFVFVAFGLGMTQTIAQTADQKQNTDSAIQTVEQQKTETQNFVQQAAEYIKNNGKDKALAEFNKKDGQFTKDSKYIVAADYEGVVLATGNPMDQNLIGTSHMDKKDAKGKPLMQPMIDIAKSGGGWHSYMYNNPAKNVDECKHAYVMPIPGDYFITSGFYTSPGPNGQCP